MIMIFQRGVCIAVVTIMAIIPLKNMPHINFWLSLSIVAFWGYQLYCCWSNAAGVARLAAMSMQ